MFSNPYLIFLFLFFSPTTTSSTHPHNKLSKNIFSPNIIVIPFKTLYSRPKNNNKNNNNNNNKSPFSSLDYYNQIHSSKIFLNMETKNGQYLRIFISTDESIFYLDDYFAELGKIDCPYSCELSPTYHLCNNRSLIYEDYNIDKPICAKDNFKLYKNQLLNEYNLTSIEFQHYKDIDKNITFTCGKTGLKLSSYNINKKGNLISQIHNKIENVDYSFTFKYTDNNSAKMVNDLDEGLFIIGIQSYEKKKNVEMDSIYVSQLSYGRKLEWKFDVYNIYIGNMIFDFNELGIEINPDIDGIEITYDFYEKLNEYFFHTYYDKKICIEEKIKFDHYIVIYCYKNKFKQKDIDNFPEINFFNNQIRYNFTFKGNELFHKIGEKLFFKMIPNTEKENNDIILGKLFLKKYQVIFNSDYKSISFYKNNINNNNFINTNTKKNILYLIIYIIAGSLILLFGIFLGKKFFNIKRRIYANELEDNNYVYESKANKNDISRECNLIDV